METVNTSDRLAKLRELMKRNKVDVYGRSHLTRAKFIVADVKTTVVPSEDAHSSEYICAADARRGLSLHHSRDILNPIPDFAQLSYLALPDPRVVR